MEQKPLKGTKTEQNLLKAFAGESQANRRYLFFAEKAEKDGFPQVARLFRAAAEAETVHARNHFAARRSGPAGAGIPARQERGWRNPQPSLPNSARVFPRDVRAATGGADDDRVLPRAFEP